MTWTRNTPTKHGIYWVCDFSLYDPRSEIPPSQYAVMMREKKELPRRRFIATGIKLMETRTVTDSRGVHLQGRVIPGPWADPLMSPPQWGALPVVNDDSSGECCYALQWWDEPFAVPPTDDRCAELTKMFRGED